MVRRAILRATREEVAEMAETGKNKTNLYTMLEVAKIAGCSKSTVYRVVKDNHLKAKKTKGQAKLYDETLIKLARTKVEEVNESKEPVLRYSVETVEKQLEIKDKQINQLQEQLKMAQVNLNQAQQALNQSLEIQGKQADKIRLLEAPKKQAEPAKKWWQFWR